MSEGSGNRLIRIGMILLFSWLTSVSCAGHVYAEVESLTYRYYTEQKWDSIIVVGKQALAEDIDYYYLRLRMGIAYYKLGQYFPAADHLNHAIDMNSFDPTPYDYLYQSYVMTSQTDQAEQILHRMHKSPEKKKYLESVYLEGGSVFSSDDDRLPTKDLFMTDSIYGEEDLYGNSYYTYLNLKGRINSAVSVIAGYSFLDFKKIKNIAYGFYVDQLDSTVQQPWGYQNYYSFPKVTKTKSFEYRVKQHEFHLGVNWALSDGIMIKPFVHLIYDTWSAPSVSVSPVRKTDTAWFISYDTSYMTFNFAIPTYRFHPKDTSFINYVAGMSFSKGSGFFTIGFTSTISNLNNKDQFLAGFSLDYFPFGNLKLYGNTSLYGFSEKNDSRIIFQQTAGGNPWKSLWLEGMLIWGDVSDASFYNGTLVYNNSGKVKYITGGSATWIFSDHLSATVLYRFSQRQSEQIWYSSVHSGESLILQKKYNNYTTNTLTAGIQWKF